MTVLGISVGTARTAVCVLKDGELVDWQLHDFPMRWSDTKLRIILGRYREYLRKHQASAVIVKVPPPESHGKAMSRLIKGVEALARDYYCEFDLTTKSEIMHTLVLSSTEELADFAQRLYPGLAALRERGIPNGHGHNKKVFEAVLAAHIYGDRLRVVKLQKAKTK